MNEENKSLFERIKSNKLIQKLKSVKHIEIWIAILITVLAIGLYFCMSAKERTPKNNFLSNSSSEESNLETIISQIKGVGKVKVLITSSSSKGLTQKSDVSQMPSEIIGVIVVAEGVNDVDIKVKILKAIQTATGVTVDKITIFEMG